MKERKVREREREKRKGVRWRVKQFERERPGLTSEDTPERRCQGISNYRGGKERRKEMTDRRRSERNVSTEE